MNARAPRDHLTQEQARRIKQVAAARGVSMASVIREALDRMLEADLADGRRLRTLTAIGGFRSGLNDVSERHDDSLADAFAE